MKEMMEIFLELVCHPFMLALFLLVMLLGAIRNTLKGV